MLIEREFFAPAGLSAAMSLAADGDMKDESCRDSFFSVLGIKRENVVLLGQCHSDNIAVLEKDDNPRLIENTDGVIAVPGNKCLGIYTADCMAVLGADISGKVFFALHCGRKGIENGIIGKALGLLKTRGIRPEDLQVMIMPHICGKCYPVNLAAAASNFLSEEGVVKILIRGECTFENPGRFFSYRRDKTSARHLSVIGRF